MDQSELKAGRAEVKQRTVAALLRERDGYKQRLNGVDSIEDDAVREKATAMLQRRVDEVSAQLAHFGHEAAAPAKRAERRPTVSARAESR